MAPTALNWIAANLGGDSKPFLPEPYNRKTYGDMYVGFWEKHQSTPYDDAAVMLRESHSKVTALFESLTDEELFEKKHFPWTDGDDQYRQLLYFGHRQPL